MGTLNDFRAVMQPLALGMGLESTWSSPWISNHKNLYSNGDQLGSYMLFFSFFLFQFHSIGLPALVIAGVLGLS